MNTQEGKANKVLNFVCQISGEAELPVRTAFELAQSLNRLFDKLEKSGESPEPPEAA